MLKSRILVLSSLVLTAVSSVVYAEPTTAPQNGSGYGIQNLTTGPFSVDLTPGRLELRPFQLGVQGGYIRNSAGFEGASVRLDMEKKYMINGSVDRNEAVGFMLNPGLHARVDVLGQVGGKPTSRIGIELSGFALIVGQSHSSDRTYAYNKETVNELFRDASEVKFESWKSCAGLLVETRFGKGLERLPGSPDGGRYTTDDHGCAQGLPEDPSTWTPAQVQEFKARYYPQYIITLKPSTAGEVVFLSAAGMYERNPFMNVESIGARIEGLKLSGETSFRIGKQVQVDFSAAGSAGAEFGKLQVGPTQSVAAGTLRILGGVGLTVGRVGRLGYEAGAQYSSNDSRSTTSQWHHNLSLSQIGKTPVRISWTHEQDNATSVVNDQSITASVRSNIFMVGGTF